jgi:hypothetical protein
VKPAAKPLEPLLKKTTSQHQLKRRGPSRVSRYALLLVALVLPLRRRLRVKKL